MRAHSLASTSFWACKVRRGARAGCWATKHQSRRRNAVRVEALAVATVNARIYVHVGRAQYKLGSGGGLHARALLGLDKRLYWISVGLPTSLRYDPVYFEAGLSIQRQAYISRGGPIYSRRTYSSSRFRVEGLGSRGDLHARALLGLDKRLHCLW